MGLFSYLCKECGHPLLWERAADKGINDWMCDVIGLGPRGEVVRGQFDGYGRVGGDGAGHLACLHYACWMVAGEPRFERYGTPSDSAPDQGWFFDDGAHDMIDPRIKEGREQRLEEGRAARVQRRYDDRARAVLDAIESAVDIPDEDYIPWSQHFSWRDRSENGVARWVVVDHFAGYAEVSVHDCAEAAAAACAVAWEKLLASDEGKALVARAHALREESNRRYLEKLRTTGRFVVRHGPSKVRGDTLNGFGTERSLFRVLDQLKYETVAVFDFSGQQKAFHTQAGYRDADSPAWVAQVEANHADARIRRELAVAEAARLNAAWAAEGYPSA